MAVLENLEPNGVFKYFEEMCSIPHGSKDTKQISDWIVSFAEKHGLWYMQDEFDNVIIKKPATKGYENSAPVILQGHIDMVCEKAADCKKDMEKEGLDIAIDGDYVFAKGTTLGGDDGIAVSMMLDILASDSYEHPEVEAVFTSDEEIGLIGATNLDMSSLNGRRLINIDSEAEGIFTVGCAGGNRTECAIPLSTEVFDGEYRTIKVSGLLGGHSGVEIDKGRANANILLGRVLSAIKSEFRIVTVNGGLKDNAIPREAYAVIKTKFTDELVKICEKCQEELIEEYKDTDKDITVSVVCEGEGVPFDSESSKKIISFLANTPNGIIKMNEYIETLVQTSLNLGVLKTEENKMLASFGVRSSVDSEKAELTNSLKTLSESLGGNISVSGDYPGWDYTGSSELKDLMVSVFEKQYGYKPEVVTIHAGLECGLFSGKIEGLDCVSIGPDMKDIHTCTERMSISSVKRVFAMILEILKQMK
ncbi:MAG: aminoacyl-histidine dipeptidase [Clostridia bacterium]|nr:aminoacyl-histidine dipeptidase [Clostridia bacterium]